MPFAHPREFRLFAIALARSGDRPVGQVARDLGISPSCLRRWLSDADSESATLRERVRQLEAEVTLLRQTAAYFARTAAAPQ